MEDVLDESYRKTGKMDFGSAQLLHAGDEDQVIKTELDKLNVYGKGSFFKSYNGTRGGAFVLRHSGQEWTFDAAALTREKAKPSIASIAFYATWTTRLPLSTPDYRVTLTYNLFFDSRKEVSKINKSIKPVAPEDHLRDALTAALADSAFLPGSLGFGRSFKYPFDIKKKSRSVHLRGGDALISRVCKKPPFERMSRSPMT
ncbi:hypothetical protein DXG01_005863 [Tephrocybe rancida]|nr:hypothetical protein DXG01_005863 [Tephrocybe rancida]